MESSKEHTESILTIPTVPTNEQTCQFWVKKLTLIGLRIIIVKLDGEGADKIK